MNNNNFNEKNADALFDIASQKLGISKEQLKQEFAQGKFDNALKNLNSDDSAKLNAALKNPEIARKMISSPQMQALYKKFSSK